jgi:hypothetical protein
MAWLDIRVDVVGPNAIESLEAVTDGTVRKR